MDNQGRQRTFTAPTGGERISDPIPLTVSIPGFFTAGQTSGNVTCTDPFTATIQLQPPLQLPGALEAHLVTASIAYTQPNIGLASRSIPGYPNGNNRISINFNGGGSVDYLVDTGLYSLPDLAQSLNLIAVNNGWITSISNPMFILIGVTATQKVLFEISPSGMAGGVFPAAGIIFNFTNPSPNTALNDSMGPVLGFPVTGGGAILTIPPASGASPITFAAPNVADFARTSAYVVFLSCLRDSSFQGATGKVLFSFPLGSGRPNSVLAFQPPLAYPCPVVAGSYSSISISFTDQDGQTKLRLDQFQAPTLLSIMFAKTKHDGSV